MGQIRFYKYFFINLDKPIIMEAESREIANDMLRQLSINSRVKIDLKRLIDVRIETPLFGISEKKRQGKELVWVGKDYTSDGWMEKNEYEQIEKMKKQNP
jgi:hypothetical protein